jgi:hypothetical protein
MHKPVDIQYFRIFCYAVPHNVLKSLVPVFFQALDMEAERCCIICGALTDYMPVDGLIACSLCKNIVLEYRKFQK